MLTEKDIKKLTSVLATKKELENLATKEDLNTARDELRRDISSLREVVQGLANAVDGLAKAIDDFRVEYGALRERLNRHEQWIKAIAEKTGTKLKM